MNILIYTLRMAVGFGVDVIVDNIARHYSSKGHNVTIGTLHADGSYTGHNIVVLHNDDEYIRYFTQKVDPDIIMIQTFPFFEKVHILKDIAPVVFWDNGDPTPELLDESTRKFIENEKKHKEESGYEATSGIIVISQFLRTDIKQPDSRVIYLGCDHMPDLGLKSEPFKANQKLKIGVLNRIGSGENTYKGIDEYVDVVRKMRGYSDIEFFFAGKGEKKYAKKFEDEGIEVKLNLTEKEKTEYLRDLDIFISFSKWEGFNLPLVEAQALGTVSLAFDIGSHPEVTPFIFKNSDDLITFILRMKEEPALLEKYSSQAYHFVRKNFKWESTGIQSLNILDEVVVKTRGKYTHNKARQSLYIYKTMIKIAYSIIKGKIKFAYLYWKENGIFRFLKAAIKTIIKKIRK